MTDGPLGYPIFFKSRRQYRIVRQAGGRAYPNTPYFYGVQFLSFRRWVLIPSIVTTTAEEAQDRLREFLAPSTWEPIA